MLKAQNIWRYPASLRLLWGWPEWSGISGRFALEWVAGMLWNQWPEWRGIGGRNGVESAAGMLRKTQNDKKERFSAFYREIPPRSPFVKGGDEG